MVNGATGPFITRTRGIFQGSVISPFLFACFIDDFVTPPLDPIWPEVLLYADDIKLQTSTPQRLQVLLDHADGWSKENGLAFNLTKCQVQAPSSAALQVPVEYHLGDQVVPRGNTYTYLGVEHKTSGLDWPAFYRRTTEKATKFLSFLRATTSTFPELAKLLVYTTYVRPIFEYAAPLGFHSLGPHDTAWKLFREVESTALSYVFNVAGAVRNKQVLRRICGLPDIRWRFEELAARASENWSRFSLENPIQELLLRAPPLSTSRLRLFASSPLYYKWVHAETDVTLRTWLSHRRNAELRLQSGLLDTYIDVDSYGRDPVLRLDDAKLRRTCLHWRRNLFFNKQCVCKVVFHRGHVVRQECAHTRPLDVTTATHLLTIAPGRCFLDFWMNKSYWQLLEEWFEPLQQ